MRASLSRLTMTSAKFPISALPLVPKPQLLIHNLTPDTHTPTPNSFRTNVLTETPSIQRRPRLLSGPCHFSHVSPFPISFPYDIEAPIPAVDNKGAYIEKWLADREAVHPQPPPSAHPNAPLRKYYAKNRDQPLDLIGVSETGLRDCVPHLDVGDAFAVIGAPSLSSEFDEEGDPQPSEVGEVVEARQDLIEVLSGHATLMSPEGSDDFAPWSLRYSGHQFGSWAGQLGDGRAVTIHVTPHPTNPDLSYELQLKGSGRTPFSRTADGLAVLRSSIREYLCSEAMQALQIPTTRSLSLISLPALPVQRERVETACVLTRMAPSFLRIGCFEAFNGPTNMFFFGGGQQKPDYEGLRVLGEWVKGRNVLGLGVRDGEGWGREVVLEVARRNARMVAGWQAYGFMHGVINTDNVSVLGLTIDYGPYAFMDVFDSFHICNHTDEGGRYAYKYQPNMIIYACRALLDALAPLIGAEAELGGKAVSAGWAEDASPEKVKEWTKKGQELREEVERVVQETTSVEYGRLMRKRLGLRRQDPTDESTLFKPLLQILESHKLDFHATFRTLASFTPALLAQIASTTARTTDPLVQPGLHEFIARLLGATPEPEKMDFGKATGEWVGWLDCYGARIEGEAAEWAGEGVGEGEGEGERDKGRGREMRGVNPRFVLRQWVLEEVIGKVERDADSGKRVLAKVMHMACNPFEPWGGEDEKDEAELSKEEREERRYCGLGDKKMLGFQCSCSS
ncbi:hypothetical protein B0H34DRAFT_665320 [Crassisporium funariophilum]|nr:hypothetical protein B0H34DRAFT_665320 [Crassisporium funariophilum]